MKQGHYNTANRKWKQISEKEWYKIEAYNEEGENPLEIGKLFESQRDRCTIERELERGSVEQLKVNPKFKKNKEMS